MERVKVIDRSVLPRTWNAIQEEFPNDPHMRKELWGLARKGSGMMMSISGIAFTVWGRQSLQEVHQVWWNEWQAAGLDKVEVGEGDPSRFGRGVWVAYLDQPRVPQG